MILPYIINPRVLPCILLLLIISTPGKSQLKDTDYYINIRNVNGTNFSYSTASDYENEKWTSRALEVVVRAKGSDYSVYTRIERAGGTGTSQIPANLFWLRIVQTNPQVRAVSYNTKWFLTSTDQLWIQEYNERSFVEDIYICDYGINPLGYTNKAGGYNYNIVFTLTALEK